MVHLWHNLVLIAAVAASPAPDPERALLAAPDHFLELKDARLRYRDLGGNGPAVLMLHGYSDDLTIWTRAADSLTGSYRVIALDQRGFGKSTIHPGAPFGKAMADDVVALLDHLGIERAHLLGFSMGALVAATTADRYPARVASVTFLAGPLYPDSAAAAAVFEPYVAILARGEGLASFFQFVYPAMNDSVAKVVEARVGARNDSTVLRRSFEALPGLTPTRAALQRYAGPSLVVVGTADPFLEHGRAAAGALRRSRMIELPQGNHGAPLGQLQWVPLFRETATHRP